MNNSNLTLSLEYFTLRSTCFNLSKDSIKLLYNYLVHKNQGITLETFNNAIEYTYKQLQDDSDYLECYNKPINILQSNKDCYICIY